MKMQEAIKFCETHDCIKCPAYNRDDRRSDYEKQALHYPCCVNLVDGWSTSGHPEATDGDVYLNFAYGDLWVVDNKKFVKINDGSTISFEDPTRFIKVGHVDGVAGKSKSGDLRQKVTTGFYGMKS